MTSKNTHMQTSDIMCRVGFLRYSYHGDMFIKYFQIVSFCKLTPKVSTLAAKLTMLIIKIRVILLSRIKACLREIGVREITREGHVNLELAGLGQADYKK